MRLARAVVIGALVLAASSSASASASAALPARSPISHVIEIMLENHTFDDLFAHFPGARGVGLGTTLPSPSPGGPAVAPLSAGANQGEVQAGLNNSRAAELAMMDRRGAHFAMDGYTRYPGEGLSAITTFGASVAPNLWSLARSFELADANFQSVIGPSLPNTLAAVSGTNDGWTSNAEPPAGLAWRSIFDELSAKHLRSAFYSGVPAWVYANTVWQKVLAPHQRVAPLSALYRALGTGQLPAFSFVRPGVGYSEEPPEDIGEGDAWLGQLVHAIGHSPAWSSTAVFITYDEGGGFWDGVSPPPSSGYGTRTPMVIVSPYARRGVFHEMTTNLSVLSYLDALFHLAPLSPLQARQNDLARAFDVHQHPLAMPRLPVVPARTVAFFGASPLSDPPAEMPGRPFHLLVVEQSPALSPVASSTVLHLSLTAPPGLAVPASFPRRLALHDGRGELSAVLFRPGYYRLTASAPGVLGDLTLDVGVGPNTP
ncbi:MAG: hypothetical protein M0004_17315 [Actinomycetota bacterium]|nr:hypothetical protein [Actinomycetota bacterium]